VGTSTTKGMKRQVSTNPDAGPPRKKVRFLDNNDEEDNYILILNIDLQTVIELENMLHSLNI
jgi:hypothetical protein